MIFVYSACSQKHRLSSIINDYGEFLPKNIINRANSFYHEQDALLFLLGRLLLLTGIRRLGYDKFDLNSVNQPLLERPYLQNYDVQFNISHSGDWVLCAITERYKLGIDIEKKSHIDIDSFRNCFDMYEWASLEKSENPSEVFYEFWTKKEAVLKADGRGLSIPMAQVNVLTDCACVAFNTWHLRRLNFAEGYIAHLAVNMKNYEFKTDQILFNNKVAFY